MKGKNKTKGKRKNIEKKGKRQIIEKRTEMQEIKEKRKKIGYKVRD